MNFNELIYIGKVAVFEGCKSCYVFFFWGGGGKLASYGMRGCESSCRSLRKLSEGHFGHMYMYRSSFHASMWDVCACKLFV